MPASVVFRELDIAAPDGVADAYLAHPDDDAAHPGVLLLMDIFGLRPWLREMTETIAAHGYTVLAPNTFYRRGRSPVLPAPDPANPRGRAEYFTAIGPALRELASGRVIEDARAYLDRLAAEDRVRPGPVALTGYCAGGKLALRIAGALGERVAAAASFHGGYLAVDEEPDSPHHTVGAITAELFLAHADDDPSIPPAQIAALEKSLDDARVRYTSVVYPGTRHGFTMRDAPAFDTGAYQRHLRDLTALLDRTFGVAPG